MKTSEGIVRREVKGNIKVVNSRRFWYEEMVDPNTGKIEKRYIRGIIRRANENGLDGFVEEFIDLDTNKIKRFIEGKILSDGGQECLSAEVLYSNYGLRELVLECLNNGENQILNINQPGYILDSAGKQLIEEFIDKNSNTRVRYIIGEVMLVGKTNAELRLVEITADADGKYWRIIDGVIRALDPNNPYIMELLEKEKDYVSSKMIQGVRQQYKNPNGVIIERLIYGKISKERNEKGELVWIQIIGNEVRQIVGELVGVKDNSNMYDDGLVDEYWEDGALVRRSIKGNLQVKQSVNGGTELHEYRDGVMYQPVKGSVKNFGTEEGEKVVLVDQYTNKKDQVVRREIFGKLEEAYDSNTRLTTIVEKAIDLDGNQIINPIRGTLKLVKVIDCLYDDRCSGKTIYDYLGGKRQHQALLGKLKVVDLNENRGPELVEETKDPDGNRV